jgi:hypothetical protein
MGTSAASLRSEFIRLAAAIALLGVVGAGCGGGDDGTGADAQVPPQDGGDGGESADASGSGALCGGFSGATCDDGLYCDYGDNRCGSQDGEGTCREAPSGCGGVYLPACGCDGEVHPNECQARASGVDVSAGGGCEAPEGTFACGYEFCADDSEYCEVGVSDVSGVPDRHECVPLPEGCGDEPSCGCLGGTFTLTCPGG